MSVLDDLDALVPPRFYTCPDYVETLGPEFADFGALVGRTPNPEQRLMLDGAVGLDKRGRLAAFEVVIVGSRQNLKTGFLEIQALGKACLLKRPLQIWTAHKESATEEAFLDFLKMIESSDELGRRVAKVQHGKGDKALLFRNGARIVFRARTGKAGQAMSADDIDLDETFAVEPKHVGSLLPTLSTRPNAQVTYASSAPHQGSAFLRSLMARGRAAAEGRSVDPRLLYAEWSVQQQVGETRDGEPIYGPPPCAIEECTHRPGTEGCVADDRELIKMANPSVGRSAPPAIEWEFIDSERLATSGAIEEYFRERLGAGVEATTATSTNLFGKAELWNRGEVTTVPDQITAIGIAVDPAGEWIGLTGASLVEADPDAEDPETLGYVAPIMRTQDFAFAIREAKRIQDETDCVVLVDEKGPAADRMDDFDAEDLAVELIKLGEFVTSCARFADKVRDGQLLHLRNAELDNDVDVAAWRRVGDRRVLDRTGSDASDVVLLEGAILAVYAAEKFGGHTI